MRTIPPTNPVQHTVATDSSSKCAKRVGVGRFSMGNRLAQPAEKFKSWENADERFCIWIAKWSHLICEACRANKHGSGRVQKLQREMLVKLTSSVLLTILQWFPFAKWQSHAKWQASTMFLEISIISCHDIILININHINHKLSTKVNKEPDC